MIRVSSNPNPNPNPNPSPNLNPSPTPNLDELPFVEACEANYTGAKLGHKIEAAQRRGAAEVGLGLT